MDNEFTKEFFESLINSANYIEVSRQKLEIYLKDKYGHEYEDIHLIENDWYRIPECKIIAHFSQRGDRYSWDEVVTFSFKELQEKR